MNLITREKFNMHLMRYRLALDLGSTSLGWAMIRLTADDKPCAVIKTGVRIFSDGRDPKDGSSLAVTRRDARAMRRRRDRLLKRKKRMMRTLVAHGFFPQNLSECKVMETVNPYALRAKGLQEALTPMEFGRALFHINQRRGFKSNRKTDKGEKNGSALKDAIKKLGKDVAAANCRTVGEYLHQRHAKSESVRARNNGMQGKKLQYDLYIDRAMIEDEFDALWAKQASLNPALFTETARSDLKDCLLYQRRLKPVEPGRCTFLPDEKRAPLALPSTQRFRLYQEVNHLRILRDGLQEEPLTLAQRDLLADALERNVRRTFIQIKSLLGLGGAVKFNFEDPKRPELKGNATSALLSHKKHFGPIWFTWSDRQQDAIVKQLVHQQNLTRLIQRLQKYCGVDEQCAEAIANAADAGLPEGYGSLSAAALVRILPELRRNVVTYDKAVLAAGFTHHSHLNQNTELPGLTRPLEAINAETGEIKTFHVFNQLPYYGEALQRHVGFGSGKLEDTPEKRFGKIANPTVHIGLNQVRLVVNALIKRYGHPSEVIVELARDLKQSQEQRKEEHERQAKNQQRNKSLRADIAKVLHISPERVRTTDLQKVILWEELSFDPAYRMCPYSGVQISVDMLLSDEVEIEHILPFSQTLDDSLNNKTVALRAANRVKGNRTPWQAFGEQSTAGFDYAAILQRAAQMPLQKRYRFAQDSYERWLKDDKGFLARALNDTRYLSRVAREYLSLICPQGTRVIPGRMTAMLRAKFGLNDVLGLQGEKNRNDHRHHAVDACVIGVTDQGLLQRFAQASASARERQLGRLVDGMELPWGTDHGREYFKSVKRAIDTTRVSHKPDHGFEDCMFKSTAFGIRRDGSVIQKAAKDGKKERHVEYIIPLHKESQLARHGIDISGQPRAYKGYAPDGNYCLEIVCSDQGQWQMEVIPTFRAYEIARQLGWGRIDSGEVVRRVYQTKLSSLPGQLVMKLTKNDLIRLSYKGQMRLLQVVKMSVEGGATFTEPHEANPSGRYEARRKARLKLKAGAAPEQLDNEEKNALSDVFVLSQIGIGDLFGGKARRVTISPIGELNDSGFKA
jgi:CRISPR-associated endonuclease Csn1